jgi:cleavage and polyadenylation specificity factor subunit 1
VKDEDTLTKGRVFVLDLEYKEGTSHDGGKTSMLKVNAYEQQERGPVTQMCEMERHLVICGGRRIFMYQFDPEERCLTAKAFWDCDYYVTSISAVKNFLVFGDILTSVNLLVYDHMLQQLVLLGRDTISGEAAAAEFMIDGDQLGVIRFDAIGNMQLLEYDPRVQRSYTEKRLLRRGDFRVGVPVRAALRLRANTTPKEYLKSVTVAADVHGGLHAFLPLDETVFRRFYALFMQMCYSLPHMGALNPIQFRQFQPAGIPGSSGQRKKNVVDADLLLRFVSLDTVSQFRLAKSIGTTREVLVSNIATVMRLLRV